jgi:hypothetical protein
LKLLLYCDNLVDVQFSIVIVFVGLVLHNDHSMIPVGGLELGTLTGDLWNEVSYLYFLNRVFWKFSCLGWFQPSEFSERIVATHSCPFQASGTGPRAIGYTTLWRSYVLLWCVHEDVNSILSLRLNTVDDYKACVWFFFYSSIFSLPGHSVYVVQYLYLYTFCHYNMYLLTNSVAWVRERTIPTERLLLVGEVNANFCG